jgi:hypothetical protein
MEHLRVRRMRLSGGGFTSGGAAFRHDLAAALARWRHPTRLHGPEGLFAASRGAIITKSPRHIVLIETPHPTSHRAPSALSGTLGRRATSVSEESPETCNSTLNR